MKNHLILLLAILFAISCSKDDDIEAYGTTSGEQTIDLSLLGDGAESALSEVNINAVDCDAPLSDYVLLGTSREKVEVQGNNTFHSGGIGNNKKRGSVEIQSDNTINDFVAGHSVNIQQNNTIGEVRVSNRKRFSNGGSNSIGNLVTGISFDLAMLPDDFGCNSGGKDIEVKGGKRKTLSPGSYKMLKVESDATVRFRPGVYCFEKIDAGSNVTLRSTTRNSSDVVLSVDYEAKFGSDNEIHVNIFTEDDVFEIGSNNNLSGAFIGNKIKVGSDNEFRLDAFDWCSLLP